MSRREGAGGERIRRCGADGCSAAADVVSENGDRCLSCADEEREIETDESQSQGR